MRVHTQQTGLASILSLLLPSFTSALGFDCSNIRVDNIGFDLSPLGGVHEISHFVEFEDYSVNTTYVLNICNVLSHAAVRGDMNCGPSKNSLSSLSKILFAYITFTHGLVGLVCGFKETISSDKDVETPPKALPIAGLDAAGGGSKDPQVTRLKTQDPSTEGIQVKLSGGQIPDEENPKRTKPASAVIEFQCDPNRTGLEGLKNDDDLDKRQTENKMRREEEGDGEDNDEENQTQSLQYKSFDLIDDKSWILRLDWKTKYACEDYKREHPAEPSSGGHWGLFTWLIIM
jgi:autophagy-related protein 27